MIINCKGKLLDLTRPQIMGGINVTPDSFFEGSRIQTKDAVLRQAEEMLRDGASILDIGGVSTRPGAQKVAINEELDRVIPMIELLHQQFPEAILSIDTFQAKVAAAAIEAGAGILNDISAWNINNDLLEVVAQYQHVPYILMHMQGTPQNMQEHPQYEDLLIDILDFFIKKIAILRQCNIKDIILDVGFGFGKTITHNYQLLQNLHIYKTLDLPLLVGISRKSMIWKLLEISPSEALNGTSVLHLTALQQGAKILRVHDVKEANEVIQLWNKLETVKL